MYYGGRVGSRARGDGGAIPLSQPSPTRGEGFKKGTDGTPYPLPHWGERFGQPGRHLAAYGLAVAAGVGGAGEDAAAAVAED